MKRILITDAGNAVGQALGRYYLDKGEDVTVIGGSLPGAVEIRAEPWTEQGMKAVCDALEKQGAPDAMIITARHIDRTSVLEGPEDAFDRMLNRNAKAAFLLTQAVGACMAENGGGAIVYIGSVHGEKPTGASLGFSCAMGALGMLNKEAALQLGRRGVHTALVEFGPLAEDEAIMDSTLTPIYDGFVQSIPRRRAMETGELGPIVDALIASPALNGASLRADGGFTLKYMDR